jgi:WD40 repeat protein
MAHCKSFLLWIPSRKLGLQRKPLHTQHLITILHNANRPQYYLNHSLTYYHFSSIADFHSGGITGLECLSYGHQMITSSNDGSLRIWSYSGTSQFPLHKLTYSSPLTCLSVSNTCLLAVGNDVGVLRIFQLNSGLDEKKKPALIHRVKLHRVPIHR